jgi:hypothetical protein
MEFEPIDGLEEVDLDESQEGLAKMLRLAITLLGKSKPELIEIVKAMSNDTGEGLVGLMLREMGEATANLEAMLDCVGTARLRVASAATNVFPEMAAAIDEPGTSQYLNTAQRCLPLW